MTLIKTNPFTSVFFLSLADTCISWQWHPTNFLLLNDFWLTGAIRDRGDEGCVYVCVWPVPEWKTGSCQKSEKSITTDIREPISGCACVWHISPSQSTQDCTSKSVQFSTHQTAQHTYIPPENPPLQFSLLQRLSPSRNTCSDGRSISGDSNPLPRSSLPFTLHPYLSGFLSLPAFSSVELELIVNSMEFSSIKGCLLAGSVCSLFNSEHHKAYSSLSFLPRVSFPVSL